MDEHKDYSRDSGGSEQRTQVEAHRYGQSSEQEDLRAVSQSVSAQEDYSHFIPPVGKQSRRHHGGKIFAVLFVLLLGAAGFAGYWVVWRGFNGSSSKPSGSSSQPLSTVTPSAQPSVAGDTKNYDSTNFSLSFDYPSSWTVAEPAGANKLTASSPVMQLTDATGQQVKGKVLLTIDQKGNNLSMFDKGSAVAVLPSQKIDYTKPSTTQRAQTYISFLQYFTTATTGALDGIYVTGDAGYQKTQVIPKVDIAKADPLIRVVFEKCDDDACGKPTDLSIQASSWSDTNFSKPIENTFKSLVVQ